MKCLVFGLEARLPIGLILGFYGYRHEVASLMQTLCHRTRCYIFNEDGLPGFVLKPDIVKFLKYALKCGMLAHAEKWQNINHTTI